MAATRYLVSGSRGVDAVSRISFASMWKMDRQPKKAGALQYHMGLSGWIRPLSVDAERPLAPGGHRPPCPASLDLADLTRCKVRAPWLTSSGSDDHPTALDADSVMLGWTSQAVFRANGLGRRGGPPIGRRQFGHLVVPTDLEPRAWLAQELGTGWNPWPWPDLGCGLKLSLH